MYGNICISFLAFSLIKFAVLDNSRVTACSPPDYRVLRSFRARAHDAEVVVFATVLKVPVEAKQHRYSSYYSAELSIHCILKGPQLPRILTVHGFGNDGGGCTTTDAVPHKSYIFLLKKFHGRYRLHNVGAAPAAKRAREKILLRLLPDFWGTSHRPYKRRPVQGRILHCPTLKKMKRILRKSMRKYIQSKPDLSKRKKQLREWLKKLRNDRKSVRGLFDLKNVTTPVITTNTVDSLRKSTMKHYTVEFDRVNGEKSSLVRRSLAKIIGNSVDGGDGEMPQNDASRNFPLDVSLWIGFVWFLICILAS